jgi:hypothetical protein
MERDSMIYSKRKFEEDSQLKDDELRELKAYKE